MLELQSSIVSCHTLYHVNKLVRDVFLTREPNVDKVNQPSKTILTPNIMAGPRTRQPKYPHHRHPSTGQWANIKQPGLGQTLWGLLSNEWHSGGWWRLENCVDNILTAVQDDFSQQLVWPSQQDCSTHIMTAMIVVDSLRSLSPGAQHRTLHRHLPLDQQFDFNY